MIIRQLLCSLLMVSFVATLSGCQTGDLGVGQQVVTPRELDVQLIDTITVFSSSVLSDTFRTDADSSVLVGRWNDPLIGLTSARGFASINYVANDIPARTDLTYDSLVLVLPIAYGYGDTTQLLTVNVHRLTNVLRSKAYYNPNTVEYEPTPWLTKTIQPRPRNRTRQVRFTLSDALRQEFLGKLRSREIIDQTTLNNYIKGFAFTGSTNASLLFALNVSANGAGLVLYYHANDVGQTRGTLNFSVFGTHFSQITTSRTGTPLQALQTRSDGVSSRLTQNRAFVDAVSQIQTRLSLPGLNQFTGLSQYRGINRAELVVYPVRRNNLDNAIPPAVLSLYQTNSANLFVAPVPDGDPNAGGSANTVSGILTYDGSDVERKLSYVFNMTYYVNEILKGNLTNRPLLLYQPTNTISTGPTIPYRRLVLGDDRLADYRLKLRLYLTTEK